MLKSGLLPVFLLATSLSVVCGEPSTKNLLKTGDMEADALKQWIINKDNAATGAITLEGNMVKSGAKAIRLKGTGKWISANTHHILIDGKKTHVATAWIRVKKGHARIQIDHFADGKWLGPNLDKVRIVKDEWTKVTIESSPRKYPKATKISIGIVSDGPEVDVLIDDVTLIEKASTNASN